MVQSRTVGGVRIHALQAGLQQLDGGAMFGVVPKTLWERKIPADARNRIKLFRLAYDAAMSGFSGRQQLYERYFAGDPVRAAGGLYHAYDKQPHVDRIWKLLDRFEKEAGPPTAQ